MTNHIVNITQMVPGPDLDRLVAERVMGWKAAHHYGTSQTAYENGRYVSASIITGNGERIDFAPSRNIAHAWEVVDAIAAKSGGFGVNFYGYIWMASFGKVDPCGVREFIESGETVEHAICLAALKYVGVTAAGDNA